MNNKENDKCVNCGYNFWEHTSQAGCPVKVYRPVENPKFMKIAVLTGEKNGN